MRQVVVLTDVKFLEISDDLVHEGQPFGCRQVTSKGIKSFFGKTIVIGPGQKILHTRFDRSLNSARFSASLKSVT